MEQKQIATKMNKDNLRNVCRTGPCAQVKKVVQTHNIFPHLFFWVKTIYFKIQFAVFV